MNAILGLGKWLFALPFLVFGLFHFMNAKGMAEAMNPPGGEIMVYITGAALIAAAVSIFIGKMDKLATALLGVMLILFVLILHLPGAMDGNQLSTTMVLKDLSMAGGAWMYARHVAKDNAVIG
ncbi:MAG TPA: hypothetical protein PKA00_13785 [Saprospiraceae bacterium]|nr:hypothetical protein [Saprospiraceae bacterium]HMQ83982.1 hypothetical protein [Saprospiraceae bacterium]